MKEISNDSCDQHLLREIENGNVFAFELLFDRYWDVAFANAYKRLKNTEDAKDIVQEVFTHIWHNRQTLHIENIAAYLHVAVRNNVFKITAKQKGSHPYFHFPENLLQDSVQADSRLLWEEFKISYEALVNTLPPKRQEIFRLRYHEDLSTQDIADTLDISRKTVQNQIGKALQTLSISLSRPLSLLLFYLQM